MQEVSLENFFFPEERLVFMEDLTRDIDNRGQLTPVILEKTEKGYRILNGGRRIASLKILKWAGREVKTVTAIVYEHLTENDRADLMAHSNCRF